MDATMGEGGLFGGGMIYRHKEPKPICPRCLENYSAHGIELCKPCIKERAKKEYDTKHQSLFEANIRAEEREKAALGQIEIYARREADAIKVGAAQVRQSIYKELIDAIEGVGREDVLKNLHITCHHPGCPNPEIAISDRYAHGWNEALKSAAQIIKYSRNDSI